MAAIASPASRPTPWERVTTGVAALRSRLGGRRHTTLATLAALLVALFAVFAVSLAALAPDAIGTELTLTDLRAHLSDGDLTATTFLDEDAVVVGELADDSRFWVAYPRSDAVTAVLIDDLSGAGVPVDVDPQVGKGRIRLAVTVLLPLMILANLFALFLAGSKGGADGIGEVVDFGRLADSRNPAGTTRVGFADVAGVDAAEVELREVVEYLRAPERYAQLGATPPKGVLLFGPPGTGKTLMARAVAGEAGVPFYSVAGAQFVESLVGVGAARVRDLFARVRTTAPAIVFVDELDALGRRRGGMAGAGGSDEREQTLNQLLVELDGFATGSGLVVIGATNRPDILDPALLRPGRFDRHIHVQPPDLAAREEILRLHARSRPISPDVDWGDLARRTPGFTGADLANVINEAALLTVRATRTEVGPDELGEAVLRVMGGTSSRGHLMTDAERHRVAVHEAGHAVVAAALGFGDRLHRVSVVARGPGLGLTDVTHDAAVVARSELERQLATTLAGLGAEQVLLGETSTAAEDDIERATGLAMAIVARHGMADEVGVRRLLRPTVDVHLGIEEQLADLSPDLHAQVDRAVDGLLARAREQAEATVTAHRDAVDRLVDALLEHETIDGLALAEYLPDVATA